MLRWGLVAALCQLDVLPAVSPQKIAERVALSLGIGLLVGLEREWAQKDLGVRTFAIASLLGMLSSLLGLSYSLVCLVGVFILVIFANARSLLLSRSLEITTSAALMMIVVLGVLIGQGYVFTPVAATILLMMLLAWKTELRQFAGGLTLEEIRSAVLIGLIGFVIYPLLPDRFIDPWRLFNPREAWLVIIVLAGIGFLNYVLLRLYGTRGIFYAVLLGGMVNSTATVAQIRPWMSHEDDRFVSTGIALTLLANVAMFSRNLAILAIFAPAALPEALWPLLAMAGFAVLLAWFKHNRRQTIPADELHVGSPLSWTRILKFGVFFVAIEVTGTLVERYAGKLGFLAVSFIGGLISSASTTATAAVMVTHGQLSPPVAGEAVVICSIASALVNVPLLYRVSRQKGFAGSLTLSCLLLAALGVIVLALWQLTRS